MSDKFYGLAIRKDGKEIRVFESRFERKVGDRLNIDGKDFYIFDFEPQKGYANVRLGMFDYSIHKDYAVRVLPESITKNF